MARKYTMILWRAYGERHVEVAAVLPKSKHEHMKCHFRSCAYMAGYRFASGLPLATAEGWALPNDLGPPQALISHRFFSCIQGPALPRTFCQGRRLQTAAPDQDAASMHTLLAAHNAGRRCPVQGT